MLQIPPIGANRKVTRYAVYEELLWHFHVLHVTGVLAAREYIAGQRKPVDRIGTSAHAALHHAGGSAHSPAGEQIADQSASPGNRTDPEAAVAAEDSIVGDQDISDGLLGEDSDATAVHEAVRDYLDVAIIGSAVNPVAAVGAVLDEVVGHQHVVEVPGADALASAVRPTAAPHMRADIPDGRIADAQTVPRVRRSPRRDATRSPVLDQTAENLARRVVDPDTGPGAVDVLLRGRRVVKLSGSSVFSVTEF